MNEKKNKEKEELLIAVNIESRISEKGSRNHPLIPFPIYNETVAKSTQQPIK